MTENTTSEDPHFDSDTALEPPALIGIIGAGPVGIEAALYARFLGYEVIVWEREEVAAAVGKNPNVSGEFSQLVTTLGVNALTAQSGQYQSREATALMTAEEWKAEYLLPLASTDLVRKRIKTQVAIEAVTVDIPDESEEDDGSTCFRATTADGQSWGDISAIIDTAGAAPFLDIVEFDSKAVLMATATESLAKALATSVTGYYLLGAKSWGQQRNEFTLKIGHDQIRALFTLIGDRKTLDLYLQPTTVGDRSR